jgi:hypothetical protein
MRVTLDEQISNEDRQCVIDALIASTNWNVSRAALKLKVAYDVYLSKVESLPDHEEPGACISSP